ncbi:hypothetical protein HJFPF1_12351 [Paramyrothecium foliicola]|nr:hypothetical protein HJFPF1_12351 [Paramyrothecium foliicola]
MTSAPIGDDGGIQMPYRTSAENIAGFHAAESDDTSRRLPGGRLVPNYSKTPIASTCTKCYLDDELML